MPRLNPIPEREVEICRRLRSYRQKTHLSQVAFANAAGIDSRLLGSYEHGRSQLNYQAAHKIMAAFAIHPRWLATGTPPVHTREPIPSCELLAIGPRRLLSEVFDNLLAERPASGQSASPAIENDGLKWLYTLDQAALMIREWIIKLPSDKLDQFALLLRIEAEALLARFPQLSKEEVERRIKTMREQEPLFAAIKRSDIGQCEIPPAPEYFADFESVATGKPMVDISNPAVKVSDVNLVIPTWKHLVKELKRLTRESGAKAQLAADLGTTRQNVNKWLSGAGAPSTELTLDVLRWVRKRQGK